MIVVLLLNVIIAIFGIFSSWLPVVDKLPTFFGFDIDALLVTGIGYFNGILGPFWALGIVLQGFLVLLTYYILKLTVKFFLGGRAPVHN